MKLMTFILIELLTIGGEPEIMSRLVEISNDNGKMLILKSEWSYLGNEPIEITYKEDEHGTMVFSFTSNDENPRTFFSEDPESLTYIEGEVIEKENERGSFILRKVSDVSVEEPW